MNISTGTSTALRNVGPAKVITAGMSGGQYSETYWVGGINISSPHNQVQSSTGGLMTSTAF